MKIRPATPDDIDALMQLADESSSAAHWTPKQYADMFLRAQDVERLALVAEESPVDSSDAREASTAGKGNPVAEGEVGQQPDLSFRSASIWREESAVSRGGGQQIPHRFAIHNDNLCLLGFLIARHLPPEWELENVVVAPSARQKGVGRQLLEALLTAARETNSESVFLEVRDSNTAARSLYERTGFQQHGRRKSYYSNAIEDAILYHLPLRKT